jgi:hypothetical protein
MQRREKRSSFPMLPTMDSAIGRFRHRPHLETKSFAFGNK